jgi:cell division protein FtsX
MKKVLIILVILTAPFLASAQDNTSNTVVEENITVTATVKEEVKTDIATSQSAAARLRAKAKDMNYKKSNDIISVKAYRKSLQIKVKEIKLC